MIDDHTHAHTPNIMPCPCAYAMLMPLHVLMLHVWCTLHGTFYSIILHAKYHVNIYNSHPFTLIHSNTRILTYHTHIQHVIKFPTITHKTISHKFAISGHTWSLKNLDLVHKLQLFVNITQNSAHNFFLRPYVASSISDATRFLKQKFRKPERTLSQLSLTQPTARPTVWLSTSLY